MPLKSGQRFGGKYTIHCVLGRGNEGGAVYRALHDEDFLKEPVALKFPVRSEEHEALRAIHDRMPGCLGVPPLLDSGCHAGAGYVVTELLGPPIKTIFRELADRPPEGRWEVLSAIGRVLLRCLQAIHACGFVHCDVQPSNILLGRSRDGVTHPFLVDFGCARPFPGGEPMDGAWGSIDFNSARSADGGHRGPYDDLESLGWVLCHGLFGDLPWFEWTRVAWESGEWKKRRDTVCRRVQRAKTAACEKGWSRLGPSWRHLAQMPAALHEFICVCFRGNGGEPDYDALAQLLGGSMGDDGLEAAIIRDIGSFDEQVVPMLSPGELQEAGMRAKDRESFRLEGVGAPWQRMPIQQCPPSAAEAGGRDCHGDERTPSTSANADSQRESSPGTPRTSFTAFDFSELEAATAAAAAG